MLSAQIFTAEPFMKHSVMGLIGGIIFIFAAFAILGWAGLKTLVIPKKLPVNSYCMRNQRAGELCMKYVGLLQSQNAMAREQRQSPEQLDQANRQLINTFLREYYGEFEYKYVPGQPVLYRAPLIPNGIAYSQAAHVTLNPWASEPTQVFSTLATPATDPDQPGGDYAILDWPALAYARDYQPYLQTLSEELAQRGKMHFWQAQVHRPQVTRPRSIYAVWAIAVLVAVGVAVPSTLQIMHWQDESQAYLQQSKGEKGQDKAVQIREELLETLFVPDRWVINYNVGTHYLNQYLEKQPLDAPDLTLEDKKTSTQLRAARGYLAKAYETIPYALDHLDVTIDRVNYACQIIYNYALSQIPNNPNGKIVSKNEIHTLDHSLGYCETDALKQRKKFFKKEKEKAQLNRISQEKTQKLAQKSQELRRLFVTSFGHESKTIKLKKNIAKE